MNGRSRGGRVDGGTRDALHVRATRLGPAFDLLAAYPGHGGFLFERDGLGVAAPSGGDLIEAGSEPRGLEGLARAVLARLRSIDRDGSAPALATGSIPFDPSEGAAVTVPGRVVRRTERGTWLLELVGESGEPAAFVPNRLVGSAPSGAFTALQLHEHPAGPAYERAVAAAVETIRAGEVVKVVLARTVEVAARRALDPRTLAHRLRAVDPRAFTFAAPIAPGTSIVGASPELLISRRGGRVRSTPLAGSSPRSGDPDQDRSSAEALFASAKDREEHQVVVDAVAEVLAPFCERLGWDPEPILVETANVWHLATRFEGALREPAPDALELVAALHPTPAVCGTPRAAAREVIRELEPFARGRYAGPVGWVDANGDGEWAIALRCADLSADRATLYAGAGIVAASDPARERDETDRKFRAFLDSLRWG